MFSPTPRVDQYAHTRSGVSQGSLLGLLLLILPSEGLQSIFYIPQLVALLECRNHELVDVETALEADEGPAPERVGRRQLVPLTINRHNKQTNKQINKPKQPKEVPLTVFHQGECESAKGFPCLDPLKLRTE